MSKIDTPLFGTVQAFSDQNDFLAVSVEFTVHEVITEILSMDNALTEKIAEGSLSKALQVSARRRKFMRRTAG